MREGITLELAALIVLVGGERGIGGYLTLKDRPKVESKVL